MLLDVDVDIQDLEMCLFLLVNFANCSLLCQFCQAVCVRKQDPAAEWQE